MIGDNKLDLIGRKVGLYWLNISGRVSSGRIIAVLLDGRVVIQNDINRSRQLTKLDEENTGEGWRLEEVSQ